MTPFDRAADTLDLPKILHRIQFYAASDLGREAVDALEPLTDLGEISRAHLLVAEMKRLIEGEDSVPMDGIKDIRPLVQKSSIQNSILLPKELLAVASTVQAARIIRSFIAGRKDFVPELFRLTDDISTFKEVEHNVQHCIDQNGEVKDTASKELRSIRQSIIDKQQSIRRALERILKATSEQGMVQEEIITTRDGRMVIPIKSELKNRFPGFIHSSSASGQTVYIEPSETLTLNNEITELLFQEKREVERILRFLTTLIHARSDDLRSTVHVLEHLDTVYAKARYSIEIKGNTPFISNAGSLRILNGFHPVLLLRHQRESIVPLNMELGGAYSTVLITGPNAGGKTVALKAVGLLALMVQCGIHIPASPDSQFPVFRRMFVLIGDNQSIENDLSTYSSQVMHLKRITEEADGRSLVLIDEIGSNTDPSEGGALAAAVLDHLTSAGALTVATSHQASLKAFVHSRPGMENGAMEFDQTTLLPTYRYRHGVPGSSYALEIAQRMGLLPQIVENARTQLGDQKAKIEQLMLDLELKGKAVEQTLEEAAENSRKSKELADSYEERLRLLKQEIRETKKRALEEASELVRSAAATIENTVKDIRSQNASRDVIKEGKASIASLTEQLSALAKETDSDEHRERSKELSLNVGDTVVLRSGGQTGTVLTLPDKNGNVTVAVNMIKARINIANVASVSRQRITMPDSSRYISMERNTSMEVDVRGMYGEEAVSAVDKFLDDAVLSGLQRVDIIHGKGTGSLRKKIGLFLEQDSRVKMSRPGEWNEGGMGVTVVELR